MISTFCHGVFQKWLGWSVVFYLKGEGWRRPKPSFRLPKPGALRRSQTAWAGVPVLLPVSWVMLNNNYQGWKISGRKGFIEPYASQEKDQVLALATLLLLFPLVAVHRIDFTTHSGVENTGAARKELGALQRIADCVRYTELREETECRGLEQPRRASCPGSN